MKRDTTYFDSIMIHNRTAILVFVKYPDAGYVKTRLAASIGEKAAAKAYERMIQYVIYTVLRPLPKEEFEIFLLCDPYRPLVDYQEYFHDLPFGVRLQKGTDLGERLTGSFREVLIDYPTAIAIGTDCVELKSPMLVQCRAHLLQKTNVVLGPAQDGGYYLIGMNQWYPSLFQGIPWSTDQVFTRTRTIAESMKLQLAYLPTLHDIDTEEDINSAGAWLVS